MLQLPKKTLTKDIYFDFDKAGIVTMAVIVWTVVLVPLVFGLWFHSWWVWFTVFMLSSTFFLAFFFLANSYAVAFSMLVVFSLLWGATGYFIGAYLQAHIGCAPPALITGVFVYLIALFICLLPLVQEYRWQLRQTQKNIP